MLKRFILITIFYFFLFQSAHGESYLRHLCDGIENSFDGPVWLPFAGGIYLLHFFDNPVHENLTGRILPGPLVAPADYYGQGVNWIVSSGYVVWNGVQNDLRQKDILQQFQYHTEAYFINAVFTFAIKDLTGRYRPDGANRHSFPSGHTSSSFVVAAMMHKMYGRQAGIPSYAIATLTGLQRIHGEKHWLTDVLAGALLGTLIGNGFGELLNQDQYENPPVFTLSFSF